MANPSLKKKEIDNLKLINFELIKIKKFSNASFSFKKLAFFSTSFKLNEQSSNTKANQPVSEWKRNVVIVPVQTTPEDLKRTHPLVRDGFYVSHRIYIEKLPEKYTVEPIKTRRTGGYEIETGL